MDWMHFLYFYCFINGMLALSELYFFEAMTKTPIPFFGYVSYLSLMYFVYAIEEYFKMPIIFSTPLELLALFLFACLIMKCRVLLSGVAAILTITILQIIYGLFLSLSHIFYKLAACYPPLQQLITPALALGSVVTVFFAYRYTIRTIYRQKIALTRQVLVLLLPTLFILLVLQLIIFSTEDSVLIMSKTISYLLQFHHEGLFLLQITALACLGTFLYAYNHLMRGGEAALKNFTLEQQAANQHEYIYELKNRYEQTRSFRHDIKNHWTVLQSLMDHGEMIKAREYLNSLKDFTENFTFPCHTGNIVINMLLSNKLGLAAQRGIDVNCTVKIPAGDFIEDIDLCIVFSNAVDNAINACRDMPGGDQYILISTSQKGSFFMIEVENSQFNKENVPTVFDIGLNNIKAIAEKYNGTISIESGSDFFKLNVLFMIT